MSLEVLSLTRKLVDKQDVQLCLSLVLSALGMNTKVFKCT